MEENKNFYVRQIRGLYLILMDSSGDLMISREYIKEKLRAILDGGISFHPVIKKKLDGDYNGE